MSGCPWKVSALGALLELAGLRAELQFDRPQEGWTAVEVDGERLTGAGLMGIEAPTFSAGESPRLIDSFVRGGDLVLAYDETPAWPIRVDATFSAAAAEAPLLAAFDLLVSVRTSLLNSRPAMAVRSRVPAEEILVFADPDGDRLEPVNAGRSYVVESSLPVVYRLPGGRFSYLEAAYPGQLHRLEASVSPPGDLAEVRHPLFFESLEKGVILRAWLRGVFAARRADLAVARSVYKSLAAEPPPLAS